MAEELLKLYAARKAVPGHAFSPDSHWQQEFEDAFEWDLTADQQTAIADIKRDMEVADADGSPAVRRRRLRQDRSGDARRVQGGDGRQAGRGPRADDRARVPASEDAARTGSPRFPVRIDMVSRFRTKAEQKATLERPRAPARSTSSSARTGCCRRTCSSATSACWSSTRSSGSASRTRSGSSRCAKRVDVLTMTATPIPRTLNMSLAGIRDMSIIETPPKDRLSIQTNVVKFDQAVIARAIRHRARARRPGLLRPQPRRVDLLDRQPDHAARARGARSASAHGQMGEDELERVMVDFVAHKYDVLRRDDDHRERPRHPERQHDDHQPRRSLRPVAALSAARPRRPIGSPRLRLPADSAGRRAVAGRARSGWRRSASSAISAAASASRRSTSRSAAPATCSAASRAATSRRSASTCT